MEHLPVRLEGVIGHGLGQPGDAAAREELRAQRSAPSKLAPPFGETTVSSHRCGPRARAHEVARGKMASERWEPSTHTNSSAWLRLASDRHWGPTARTGQLRRRSSSVVTPSNLTRPKLV